MTGHVRRRGAHSWEIKFDVGADPQTGKRRIRYASFKGTKRGAEIELARLVSANAAGEGVDPTKATVAEFLDRWDRDWASTHVSPKTLERYRQTVKLYAVPHVGSMRVQKLRPVHLNELYAGRRERRPATVGAHRRPRPSRSAPCARACRDLGHRVTERRRSGESAPRSRGRNHHTVREPDRDSASPSRGRHPAAHHCALACHRRPPRRGAGASLEGCRPDRR
jgi:hypothetical protein